MVEGSIELVLNKYLELISPKEGVKQDDIDSKGEIIVYTRDEDYDQVRLLTIINYGNHIKVEEYYYSYLGDVTIEKVFHGVKPSSILRLFFPKVFM
jgi:hypothetical protein